ncbi:unnamed protein product [Didymodactylos carnosus]|uniref:PTPRJ transmembrane domain-containing protein n=1 Tax=Didymodactylos carnosus TaxID=1234261 RepID=A0A8S2RSC3_9BILA|nr:unnamed protein product [Didymodactylos carnosus]
METKTSFDNVTTEEITNKTPQDAPPPPREQYNSSLITLSNASPTQLCITINKTLFVDDHGPIIKYEIYVRQDQNNNELYPTIKARTYEEANQDYLAIISNEHTGATEVSVIIGSDNCTTGIPCENKPLIPNTSYKTLIKETKQLKQYLLMPSCREMLAL